MKSLKKERDDSIFHLKNIGFEDSSYEVTELKERYQSIIGLAKNGIKGAKQFLKRHCCPSSKMYKIKSSYSRATSKYYLSRFK